MNDHPIVALIRAKLADASHPFTILADLEAHPGRGNDLASAIAQTKADVLSQAEPGCVAYEVYRDAESTDRFVVYECWRDLTALADHLTTPHFAAVGAAVTGILATAPTIRVLTPTRQR